MSCKNYKSLHIYFLENYNVGKPQKNFAFILMAWKNFFVFAKKNAYLNVL